MSLLFQKQEMEYKKKRKPKELLEEEIKYAITDQITTNRLCISDYLSFMGIIPSTCVCNYCFEDNLDQLLEDFLKSGNIKCSADVEDIFKRYMESKNLKRVNLHVTSTSGDLYGKTVSDPKMLKSILVILAEGNGSCYYVRDFLSRLVCNASGQYDMLFRKNNIKNFDQISKVVCNLESPIYVEHMLHCMGYLKESAIEVIKKILDLK